LPIGIIAALRRNSLFDHVSMVLTLALYGLPTFWLAIFLIDIFAIRLQWFPASGIASIGYDGDIPNELHHLFLPALTLTIPALAGWIRYQRGAMIDVLQDPFMRTARSKGLPERIVVIKHALRNALMPTITLFGLSLPGLFGGAYFVEYIFAIPGMGYLGLNTVFQRDYPTLMGITMISAILVVVGNLLADVLYAVVDPRIRYE
jgi:peptide/nickel transport system permease protein